MRLGSMRGHRLQQEDRCQHLRGSGSAANGGLSPGRRLQIARQLPVQAALAGVLGRGRVPNGAKAGAGHVQQAAHRARPGRAGRVHMAAVRALWLDGGNWTACLHLHKRLIQYFQA